MFATYQLFNFWEERLLFIFKKLSEKLAISYTFLKAREKERKKNGRVLIIN